MPWAIALHMKIHPITSASNGLLKTIRGLHQRAFRRKKGLFLIEGPRAVDEVFRSGVGVVEVVVSESFLEEGLPEVGHLDFPSISVVDDQLFKGLVTTSTPCGILALAKMPSFGPADIFACPSPLILVAHAIQDPGNLGTMMRTALAASADGMIATSGTVDPFNPKVVRSAMGALFSLPFLWDISWSETLKLLKEHGVRVVACDPEASLKYFDADLTGPLCLVFGNEGQGFSEDLLQDVDQVVSIPMSAKSESLNVAVSAGIVLFAAVEQRQKG